LGAAALAVATPALSSGVQGPRGDEPIAVPRSIKQGVDFVYVDPAMSTVARRHQRPQNWLARIFKLDLGGGNRAGPNVLFQQLARGMQQYQMAWGRLPQTKIPAGPVLKRGSKGRRVDLLRERLGLPAGGGYDERLFQAVATYQTVHGLGRADGVAGKGTIASLNLGAQHYLRRLAINVAAATKRTSHTAAYALTRQLRLFRRPVRTASSDV